MGRRRRRRRKMFRPKENYLVQLSNKRRIKPKQFQDCVSKNIVDRFQTNNTKRFKISEAKNSEQYKNSFFVRTVAEWNTLDNEAVHAGSVDAFKAHLKKNN